MFSVECQGPDIDGRKVIAQGVSFGYGEASIVFSVTTQEIEIPLTVRFRLADSDEYGRATVEVGRIIENSVEVVFYNSASYGKSGLNEPVSIVALGDFELLMTFHIESNPPAPAYIMFYEFSESPLALGAGL